MATTRRSGDCSLARWRRRAEQGQGQGLARRCPRRQARHRARRARHGADGIHDDAAARALAHADAKLVDGRAAAGAMAEAKRLVAPRALPAGVAKQKPVADAALKKAQAVEKREAARKEIDVATWPGDGHGALAASTTTMRNAVNADLTAGARNYDKADDRIADLGQAGEKAFPAMKPRGAGARRPGREGEGGVGRHRVEHRAARRRAQATRGSDRAVRQGRHRPARRAPDGADRDQGEGLARGHDHRRDRRSRSADFQAW